MNKFHTRQIVACSVNEVSSAILFARKLLSLQFARSQYAEKAVRIWEQWN